MYSIAEFRRAVFELTTEALSFFLAENVAKN